VAIWRAVRAAILALDLGGIKVTGAAAQLELTKRTAAAVAHRVAIWRAVRAAINALDLGGIRVVGTAAQGQLPRRKGIGGER